MSEPGQTARRVAERRAAHQLLDLPVVLSDPLALKMAGIVSADDRSRLVAREQGRLARTLRAFLAARARAAEDELRQRVADGLAQYVILGAGFDTFAYRSPYGAGVRVFEVDQPAVQALKLRRLDEAGIVWGPMVTHVPVEFESMDLRTTLVAAGWREDAPTLFAWLGVTMYLETATVHRVLRDVARGPAGTAVVFDYALAPHLLGPVERLVFDEFAARVAAAGEPWVSTFQPELLRASLVSSGFSRLDDAGPDELNARYFADRADGMRVGRLAHVMVASV